MKVKLEHAYKVTYGSRKYPKEAWTVYETHKDINKAVTRRESMLRDHPTFFWRVVSEVQFNGEVIDSEVMITNEVQDA